MSPPPALFTICVAFLLASATGGIGACWVWAIGQYRRGRPLLPAIRPRIVPWGLGTVLLVIVTWLLINFGVAEVYTMALGAKPLPFRKIAKGAGAAAPHSFSFTDQMAVVSLVNGLVLLLVPLVARLTSRARLTDLGVELHGVVRHLWVGLVAFFLIAPIVYSLNGIAVLIWVLLVGIPERHPLEHMVRTDFSLGIIELAIVSAVMLAPAAEELIFRGIIQGWLTRVLDPTGTPPSGAPADLAVLDTFEHPDDPYAAPPQPRGRWLLCPFRSVRNALIQCSRSRVSPNVLTSALFALVHMPQWPAPLAIFGLSLGLGLVYERTGSLISAFAMHAMFNALGTLLLFQSLLIGGTAGKKPIKPPTSCIIFHFPSEDHRAASGSFAESSSVDGGKSWDQDNFPVGARSTDCYHTGVSGSRHTSERLRPTLGMHRLIAIGDPLHSPAPGSPNPCCKPG